MRHHFYTFLSVLMLIGCSSNETTEDLGAWAEYELSPPTDEQKQHLLETPYRYPTQSCKPITEVLNLPDDVDTTETENGEEVCVWNSPTAVAPVGVNFSEIGSCEHVFTQAPSWFVHPEREFQSSASLLMLKGAGPPGSCLQSAVVLCSSASGRGPSGLWFSRWPQQGQVDGQARWHPLQVAHDLR